MKSTFRLRPLQAAVMLALASASSFSYALRLGEPVVKSYVGQPLVAEFAIEETSPEELRRLQIALANPSLYTNMKAAFHPALKTSSLAIVDRSTQTPKLVLRTEGPVEDSVVDIVFELTWAAGRMIQSSTVLIDPAPAGVAVETPAFVPSPVVVVEVPAPVVSNPIPAPGPVPYTTALTSMEKVGPQTVVVQKGDTLSKIATRMNLSGVKLEQLLIALYNKNSKTIASKNMNLIREGTILALPTKQEALAVDASQAMKTVALHASNFRSYAQNLAQQSGSSTSVDKAPRSQTGSVNSEIIERQTGTAAKDQVRIGAGSEGSTTGSRVDKAPEIQFKNAQAENKSRQSEMEKNLKDLEALAKLKNEQLAKMQQRAGAASVAPAASAPASSSKPGLTPPPEQNTKPVVAAPVSEPLSNQAAVTPPAAVVKPEAVIAEEAKAKAEMPKLAVAPSTPAAAPVISSPPGSPIIETPMLPDTLRPNSGVSGPDVLNGDKPAEVKPKAPVVAAPVVPKEIKPAAAAAKPMAAPEESLLEDQWPLLAGGVGILTLLGGWLYTRRKKKIEDDEYVEEEPTNGSGPAPFGLEFPSSEHAVEEHTDDAEHAEEEEQEHFVAEVPTHASVEEPAPYVAPEPLEEELEAASYLNDMPDVPVHEPSLKFDSPEPVEDFSAIPYVETPRPQEVAVEDVPYMAPAPLDTSAFSFEEPAQEAAEPEPAHVSPEFEVPNFDLSFNPAENEELETLTRSLASGMPSLEEPTPASDTAAYPVSLTYDPDEQLGIAKFYLGLQDYRGVWDMVHPLLNHERDDVKAQAFELLSDIPDDLRAEWTAEK